MDYLGRPIENPTVQIDVESGKRFDISYLNERKGRLSYYSSLQSYWKH